MYTQLTGRTPKSGYRQVWMWGSPSQEKPWLSGVVVGRNFCHRCAWSSDCSQTILISFAISFIAFLVLLSSSVAAETLPIICNSESSSATNSSGLDRSSVVLRSGSTEFSTFFLPLSPAEFREIELIAVASGDFTAGRSEEEVIDQIQQTVKTANRYYAALGLVIKLAGVQVFQGGEGDPYQAAAAKKNATEMLNTLRAQWSQRNSPSHDAVALFARSTFGRTYGIAYPSVSCLQPNLSFLFISQGGESEANELALGSTLAHELGHVIGMYHDSNSYADGPSVMWPIFATNVNGFSDFSKGEYEAYRKSGGADCFSIVQKPESSDGVPLVGSVLSFVDGVALTQHVPEGTEYRRSFPVNYLFPGLTYQITGLPGGASFDRFNGELRFRPEYSVADRKNKQKEYQLRIQAQTFSQSAVFNLTIIVDDVNQNPVISPTETARSRSLSIVEGQELMIAVESSDNDLFDRARLTLLNSKSVRNYPGRPRITGRRGKRLLRWLPPFGAAGDYEFVFEAKDRSGAKSSAVIVVHVLARNLPPVLEVPSALSLQKNSGKLLAVDPEGNSVEYHFRHLPAGSHLSRVSGQYALQVAAKEFGTDIVSAVEVSADDGKNITKAEINLSAFTAAGDIGVEWPGQPVQHSSPVSSSVFLYSQVQGTWEEVQCQGGSHTMSTFGGILGDVPLEFRVRGERYRAVYRVLSGQGHWLIETSKGVRDVEWGLARDIPLTGDLDGDGEDDLILFRPSSNDWFILGSQRGVSHIEGSFDTGDATIPFADDVDGDGKADLVLFSRWKSGEGVFNVRLENGDSHQFVVATSKLGAILLPFVADFDGDGRADFAVSDSATGTMSLFLSETGMLFERKSVILSDSLIATLQCGGSAGKDLLVFDSLARQGQRVGVSLPDGKHVALRNESLSFNLDFESLVTPEVARLRRSNIMTSAVFGDESGYGRTNFNVWRADKTNSTGRWISRSSQSSEALLYPSLPANYSFQTAGHFAGSKKGSSALTNFVDGTWITQASDGSFGKESWGQYGDVPVAADYNGDGVTDYAIYRVNDSSWWILFKNQDGGLDEIRALRWGQQGDLPVPADYDGDGASDVAIFRPATASWYVLYADGRVKSVSLGTSSDYPVPGDYFGRGKAEFAVWHAQDGTWIVRSLESKASQLTQAWGLSTDNPVKGDFDGDGRAELAVFRASEGAWYFIPFGASIGNRVPFGLPNDTALGAVKELRIF